MTKPMMMAGLALASAILASGCATAVRGTTQSVKFESFPSGALVKTYRNGSCVTPCSLRFHRKDRPTVLIEKEGYEPQQVGLRAHASRSGVLAAYGNIIAGGGVGAIVDGKTKAFKGFLDPVSVVLEPKQGSQTALASARD